MIPTMIAAIKNNPQQRANQPTIERGNNSPNLVPKPSSEYARNPQPAPCRLIPSGPADHGIGSRCVARAIGGVVIADAVSSKPTASEPQRSN